MGKGKRNGRVAAVLVALGCLAGSEASASSLWQLRFEYDAESVRLAEATPIRATVKRLTQPGFQGAASKYEADLEWLGADGTVLATTPVVIPFGTRTVYTKETPCESYIENEGVAVIRIAGPDAAANPVGVRLYRAPGKSFAVYAPVVPDSFRTDALELPIEHIGGAATKDGPVDAEKIQNSGPDSNRLVIVVCGDGYTASELQAGAFDVDAQNLLTSFHGRAPWDVYFEHTNVYQINTISNQSGSDNEGSAQGPLRDTYYESMFHSFGIERLLTISNVGASRAVQAADSLVGAGVWDYIFMLVNSDKYGGSGGPISVSSVNGQANEVILHEFGHTFAGLADEYDSPIPSAVPQDPEPNVELDFSLNRLKWRHWVSNGTPLPTPETSQYANVVGAFEGARYFSTGIYRPWLNCLMRNLGQSFCPVCSEEHTVSYFDHVRLIDQSTPSQGSEIEVSGGGVNVGVTTIGVPHVRYEWRMNDSIMPGKTTASISLIPSEVPAGSNTLSVNVTHDTPLVRKTSIGDSRSWTVRVNAVSSPANDSCRDATPVFLNAEVSGSSINADGNRNGCGTNDKRDVWHVFNALDDGTVRFSTCAGSDFDTTLSVYDRCSGSLLACNDNTCGETSEVELPVQAGEDYLIRIAGVNNTTGNYTLLAEEVVSMPASCCRDGDVNGDGRLTPRDAQLIEQFLAGEILLDECEQARADIYRSQDPPQVTERDAQCIFRFFMGSRGSCSNLFPKPCSG